MSNMTDTSDMDFANYFDSTSTTFLKSANLIMFHSYSHDKNECSLKDSEEIKEAFDHHGKKIVRFFVGLARLAPYTVKKNVLTVEVGPMRLEVKRTAKGTSLKLNATRQTDATLKKVFSVCALTVSEEQKACVYDTVLRLDLSEQRTRKVSHECEAQMNDIFTKGGSALRRLMNRVKENATNGRALSDVETERLVKEVGKCWALWLISLIEMSSATCKDGAIEVKLGALTVSLSGRAGKLQLSFKFTGSVEKELKAYFAPQLELEETKPLTSDEVKAKINASKK